MVINFYNELFTFIVNFNDDTILKKVFLISKAVKNNCTSLLYGICAIQVQRPAFRTGREG